MKLKDWIRLLAAGLGGALIYALLATFIKLPPLFGIRLRFDYLALVLVSVCFGPLEGFAAGFFGALLSSIWGGGIWWSVIAAAAFIGFATGYFCRGFTVLGGKYPRGLGRSFVFGSLLAQGLASLLITPVLDMVLYKEALSGIFRRGLKEAVVNFLFVAVFGTVLLHIVNKISLLFKRGNKRGKAKATDTENWEDILE